MSRPITLFTGQWADLPLEEARGEGGGMGVRRPRTRLLGRPLRCAARPRGAGIYQSRWEILNKHGLQCFAIATHLVGQAVCDPIDARHQAILPPHVWGDGEPEGVRQRAAHEVMDTARAAAKFGVGIVTGFSGSSIWHLLYSFPPNDFAAIERGYADFADALEPDHGCLRAGGVRFGLEVHPTEIAYDFVTTRKALDALGNRPEFGINFDP